MGIPVAQTVNTPASPSPAALRALLRACICPSTAHTQFSRCIALSLSPLEGLPIDFIYTGNYTEHAHYVYANMHIYKAATGLPNVQKTPGTRITAQ